MVNLNRLEKLSLLLESKNRLLRQEAVEILAKIPIQDPNLFVTLLKYLNSSVWEARSAAADAIGQSLANNLVNPEITSEQWECSTSYDTQNEKEIKMNPLEWKINSLEGLNLAEIIDMYLPLLRYYFKMLKIKIRKILARILNAIHNRKKSIQ